MKFETRPGVTVTSHYLKNPEATATVILLTGGSGSIGLVDGEPRSINFLIRSRQRFFDQGFNVFSMGRPSDRSDLDGVFRSGANHLEDLRRIVEHLKAETGKPVWLIGTSLGTISATAGAVGLGDMIAGAVLTSSVTGYQIPGAPARQSLDQIRVPVLIVHHRRDACRLCLAGGTSWIMRGLTQAPIKKRMLLDGGDEPRGNECEPLHWHGFINMEDEAVRVIAEWIRQPNDE